MEDFDWFRNSTDFLNDFKTFFNRIKIIKPNNKGIKGQMSRGSKEALGYLFMRFFIFFWSKILSLPTQTFLRTFYPNSITR